MSHDYIIEPLRKDHVREQFDCGEPELNTYLEVYARQSDGTGLGRTFVAVLEGSRTPLGYYTLASGSITFDIVPKKLPRYPIPVIHLARLAVDRSAQGKGLGGLLLANALQRSVGIAMDVGVYAVELYAKNESAKLFYSKFGFTELSNDHMHLYLPIRSIQIPEIF